MERFERSHGSTERKSERRSKIDFPFPKKVRCISLILYRWVHLPPAALFSKPLPFAVLQTVALVVYNTVQEIKILSSMMQGTKIFVCT